MVSSASQEENLFGLIVEKQRSSEDIDNSLGRLNSGQCRGLNRTSREEVHGFDVRESPQR